MSKDWGRSESEFKLIECISALLGEIPGEAFVCEPSEWDSDGRISINKSSVKVCKTEEGLDVADFARFGPILNAFDFVISHGETLGREHVTEVFDQGCVE